jgi:hypothetical protein
MGVRGMLIMGDSNVVCSLKIEEIRLRPAQLDYDATGVRGGRGGRRKRCNNRWRRSLGDKFSQIKIFGHEVREEKIFHHRVTEGTENDFPRGQVGHQLIADYGKLFRGCTRNAFLCSSPKDFSVYAKTHTPKIINAKSTKPSKMKEGTKEREYGKMI